MSRLLALWLTLLAAFWLTRAASSALLFGTAVRGPGEAFQLVVVPALQALLVAWATRRPGPFRHSAPLRLGLRQTDVRGLLVLDAAVLLTGWIFAGHPWLGLAQGRNLQSAWIAIKTGTAGAFLARSARGDRWVLALAAGLLVLAGLVLAGLVGPAPDGLLRWLVLHGLLLAAGTGLVLEAQRQFRKSRPAAALALDWALGLALLAGLTGVLDLGPFAGIAASLGSLASTALLVASRLEDDLI
ncbi:MAG TPA: hypothetical protein VH394_11185 [Thermoanaerobaculia bacterium]|nr:hypothetical protein [Thermoanaerobaculia bacterium]